MRPRTSLVLNALAALVLLAVALASPPGHADDWPRFDLVDASGVLSLSNSKAGEAIFHGEQLAPGEEARGSVTIANRGGVRASYAVEATAEDETAGAGGGRLWDALRVVATDVTVPDAPFTVYEGSLAAMGRVTFGGLSPGRARSYEFAVSLPRTSEGDDAYQGARLSLRLDWSAAAVALAQPDGATPTPTPASQGSPTVLTTTPVPTATATPAPLAAPAATPTPTPRATPALTAEDVVSLPSAKSCVSRRAFRIRVRAPRGVAVRSTTVYVNGRRVASKRASEAAIDLRGLPPGTVRVRVVAVLSDGRRLVLRRTYRTCTARAARVTLPPRLP